MNVMKGDALMRCTERLIAAWQASDELFALIPEDRLLFRPIGLRHPFLFYLGHLPAFGWNQIGRGALSLGHLDEALDTLFQRGIDPCSEEGARRQSIAEWPSLREVTAYRDRARVELGRRLGEVFAREDDILCERGRVIHLVIEHELMHQETLLYMFAECPPGMIERPSFIAPPEAGPGRVAEPRRVPAGEAVIGAAFDEIEFGWDNEFSRTKMFVPAFEIDSLPARNIDWLSFYEANQRDGALLPRSWTGEGNHLSVKTVFGAVPFEIAEGWPAQVSGEQARAYCEWRGGRLPTEAELHRAAYSRPDGTIEPYPWGRDAPDARYGNFGLRPSHYHPTPVGRFPAGASAWGVEELVGNGWEWTSTPFAPLPGFSAWARTYAGYSADFFDGAHDIVFGASWATHEALLRPSFRNWYRRNYPYPFTSFRVVRPV